MGPFVFASPAQAGCKNSGGGNQLGYDGRYTDPRGRSFYITGNYRF
jgi:hypothetical protein